MGYLDDIKLVELRLGHEIANHGREIRRATEEADARLKRAAEAARMAGVEGYGIVDAAGIRRRAAEAVGTHTAAMEAKKDRLAMAARGKLLVRPNVETRDHEFMRTHQGIMESARKAGLLAYELDDDLKPPPAAEQPAAEPMGWNGDKTVLRVRRAQHSNKNWRDNSHDLFHAMTHGKRVDIID